MSPVLKASTKAVVMHFLQGMAVHSFNCWGYKICSFIEYVTRKQMDSLTFKAKSAPQWWTVYIRLFSIDPKCSHCPSRNSPNNTCGQGHVVSPVDSTAHNKPPTLILLAVAVKPLSNHGGRLKARPLDSRYDSAPSPKQALADLLRQN